MGCTRPLLSMSFTILVAHSWKLLTDHRSNGDGLFAYGLLRRLAERGHRLHVVCRAVDLSEPPPAGLKLYPRGEGDGELAARERMAFMRRLRRIHDELASRERIDLVHQTNTVEAGVSLALPGKRSPVLLGPYWADWPGAAGPDHGLGRRVLQTFQQ